MQKLPTYHILSIVDKMLNKGGTTTLSIVDKVEKTIRKVRRYQLLITSQNTTRKSTRLEYGRRNLTDGWKYKLQQIKKEILLEKGKEKQLQTLKQGVDIPVVSTIDTTEKHSTRQEIAKALDWSTGGGI